MIKPNPFASLVGRTMATRASAGSAPPQVPPTQEPPAHATLRAMAEPTSKFYAGIGSRSAPPEILTLFRELATRLEAEGWTLRSGGAAGADSAFEEGVSDPANPALAEIYIPWSGFNGRKHGIRPPSAVWNQARLRAAEIHPIFDKLKPGEQSLHTRNVFQICGADLDAHHNASVFVICWTPDGSETTAETGRTTGGTRTGIALASNMGIPVINFASPGAAQRLESILDRDRQTDRPRTHQRT